MSLERLIGPKTITKTVDPGAGDNPLSSLIKKDPKPTESLSAQAIETTSLPVLVKDLIEEAQNTQDLILQTIAEIDTVNSSDSGFSIYHQMVRDNFFNPKVLLTNKTAKPNPIHEASAIKAAERDVYRRINDPRAPFVQDLYDHLADAGISEYVLKSYWEKITSPNELYSGASKENPTVKFALQKEKQHLSMLRNSTQRIRQTKLQKLSEGFIRALSQRVINNATIAAPHTEIQHIGSLIKTLKLIKTVLYVSAFLNTESWEKFYTNVKDIYGNFLQVTANKVVRTTAYNFSGEIQSQIFDLLGEFESYIPFGIGLHDIPESREFVGQINKCFSYFLASIEDDLVAREAIQIKLEENRQLLVLNAVKNSQTKQFIKILDDLIIFLEAAKHTLANISTHLKFDIDDVSHSLINGLHLYESEVASTPPKKQNKENSTNNGSDASRT